MEMVQRALLWAAVLAPLAHARANYILKTPVVQVQQAAASKPVGTGPAAADQGQTARCAGEETIIRYEEYMVEHEVSSIEARRAATALNLDNVPLTRDGCGACTNSDMQYCERRVLDDHCCCERGFYPEPFPWIPHTCYIGRDPCHPAAHDCESYNRLRDCCCHRILAEKYKSLVSSSTRLGVSGASLLLLSMLLLVARL